MTRNRTAFTATVAVAFIAAALAVFAIWQMNAGFGMSGGSSSFTPSDEQKKEMSSAAKQLINNNYEIVKLFYVNGLPTAPEPYGNIPQDGILTVVSDEYASLSDIDSFVDSVFVPAVAETIKNDPAGNGPLFYDRNGVLGQSYEFEPDKNYPISWEQAPYTLNPISETECDINLTLRKNGIDTGFETSMIKENGKWLLTKIIYQ
ncbi:MAG: hypothetical protein LBR74_10500 [Eubacterium sp.]|jgi:hypothetical protein|nr:hypothetical protein [Eubacterium sp.]